MNLIFTLVFTISAAGAEVTESSPAETTPSAAISDAPKEQPEEEIEELFEVEEVSESEKWFAYDYPAFDRAGSMMTAKTQRRNSLGFFLTHRAHQALRENAWHDYLGLDAGLLKIGLGLRYGIIDALEIGFQRVNNAGDRFDTYEFDLKYNPLNQENHYIDLAVRGVFTWFSQRDASDAIGGGGQLLISRVLFNRLTVGSGALFHSHSSSATKLKSDIDYSFAAQLLLECRIIGALSVFGESAVSIVGYGGKYPIIAFGLKAITNRHTFAILFSNSQYTSADGVVANTDTLFKDLIFGFSLSREWNF